MLTETERAYLAGFFDGDGCINISISKSKNAATVNHQLHVIFAQCNEAFLEEWMHKTALGKIYKHRWPNHKARKIMYHWRMSSRQAEKMLNLLLPYLQIKRQQAEVALRFQRTKGHYGGPHSTPQVILKEREQLKQLLHDLKAYNNLEAIELQAMLECPNLQLKLMP